jgi:hypothetical protein
MNEMKRTLIFAGLGVVLALLAIVTRPGGTHEAATLSDLGQEFYPRFKDPLAATSLEITDYDEANAQPRRFKVELQPGKGWVIPSHYGYRADAKDRMKNAADSVIDLKKETLRSERPQDFEAMGVVDPSDESAGTKGRGKRIVLRDLTGQVLVDYIFGRETKEGSGMRFVRLPDQKRTYATHWKADISTNFEDWVERDLLKLTQSSVRRITIDNYVFNEQKPGLENRTTLVLARDESSSPWKLGELKETEEINTDNVSSVLSTLSDLKLAGVRPKPKLITQAKDLSELSKLPRTALIALARELARWGFYVMQNQQDQGLFVVSNEGEMEIACDDGVVYRLLFGAVFVGSGEDVTAGQTEDDGKAKDPKKDKEKKGGTEHRYLFVSARFDESAFPALAPEPKPPEGYKPEEKKDGKKPDEKKPDAKKPEDSPEVAKYKKDKEEWDHKKQERDRKIEDGRKRAKELSDRFAEWYYVISADSFKKLRRPRAELVKLKEVKKDEKKPEETKPDEKKPEDKKPEEKKADEKKTEAPKDGEKKTEKAPDPKKPEAPKEGEKKSGDPKPEEKKPADKKADEKKP